MSEYTIEDFVKSGHQSDVMIGDMLEKVSSGFIIHGCNAQGVMGSGIAKAVKSYYPEAYTKYMQVHESTGLRLGDIIPVKVTDKLFIVNCITQEYFGKDGRRYVSYDAIDWCAKKVNWLAAYSAKYDIEPIIHTPLIGAGLGGGDWGIIEMILLRTIKHKMLIWALTEEAYQEASA